MFLVTVPVLAAKALVVFLLLLFAKLLVWLFHLLFVAPPFDPLRNLPGPGGSMFDTHLREVME
jgi:hypothetical protein